MQSSGAQALSAVWTKGEILALPRAIVANGAARTAKEVVVLRVEARPIRRTTRMVCPWPARWAGNLGFLPWASDQGGRKWRAPEERAAVEA